MKTSVIGFARIGKLRELKFTLEDYFRGAISQEEVLEESKRLRLEHWKIQQDNNIDFIPSNDFSLYDNVLDTAYTLNVIPKRYKELELSPTDTYFAMARGYQGDKGDVKALAMKKWFDTNYHYIVPEIEDDTEIRLSGEKMFDEYKEGIQNGIQTKPVITGAFTFLKLARFTGEKNIYDFIDQTAKAYIEIIKKFNTLGAEWIQFDEPYIVTDLNSEDKAIFTTLYRQILLYKDNVKVILQTYFGDVRDCYEEICELDFDGIGIDFVSGKKSLELIENYGFPKEKTLFAGVVNGRNIWKNHFEQTVSIVKHLREYSDKIVIGTSSSLLHVPYTLENEDGLSEEYKKYFAFAFEKLTELDTLSKVLESVNPLDNEAYKANTELFAQRRNCTDKSVQERVKGLKEEDFTRLPKFEEREKIQKETFKFPLFPTTTIGSFPQTDEIRRKRRNYKRGFISYDEYVEFNKLKMLECIRLQEKIGLDVLVHGEFERNDMVEYFGERLEGFLFTQKAWVQSYGTRCVKPPVIWGDVSRREPMTVKWAVWANGFSQKNVKGMLTGAVTILNWSFPREDIELKESAYQIALAIKDEVSDLEKNGIKIIQIDEAALREKLPLRKADRYTDYLDWAIPSFRLIHSSVKPETQIHTHMCYSEFTDIIEDIDNMDADVITFEASRSDLTILDFLKEKNFKTQVGAGVYDIHSPRVPSVEEIETAVDKMAEKLPKDKLWINPDCGLKTRGEAETVASLTNMVQAAQNLRKKYE